MLSIDSPPDRLVQAREDFPILQREIHGRRLVYLDSAASSLKPRQVIDRISHFYAHEYGTVRRGVYTLSQEATALYEGARATVARFIGAPRTDEVVFVRGVTEGINLIATSLSRGLFEPGDEVVVTTLEHHANIVPWHLIAQQSGIVLREVPITDAGEIDLDALRATLNPRTRLVATNHVSNALGTLNPVAEIGRLAHEVGALFLVDGAQSTPPMPIDVKAMNCDFFVFSGHKMLGPTGIGALWGRYEWLEKMPPYQGGGEMIDQVTFCSASYDAPPYRFEAGTPAFAQAIGLAAAIEYLEAIGMETVAAWDHALVDYATERLQSVDGLLLQGGPANRCGLVPFTVEGVHTFDLGTLLDQYGVAVRTGQHCAQPVMRRFGTSATARASFYLYNTKADIDALVEALEDSLDLLR